MSESYDFLVGEPVNQVWVWGPIRLVIESQGRSANVDLGRLAFTDPTGKTVEIDAVKSPRSAGPLLDLIRKHVTSAESADGMLVLRFDDGSEVRAYPDERYESCRSPELAERTSVCQAAKSPPGRGALSCASVSQDTPNR